MKQFGIALGILLTAGRALSGPMDITAAYLDPTPPTQALGWIEGAELAQSPDGRYVVHSSLNKRLVEGQLDNEVSRDVFVYDRVEGSHQLVSHHFGAPNQSCLGDSFARGRMISTDGRWIAFDSSCQDLVAGSIGEAGNVFLRDRQKGETRLLSRVPGSGLPAGRSQVLEISADGRWVLFFSTAASLGGQLFLADRDDPTGNFLRVANQSTFLAEGHAMSADGRFVAFASPLPNLDPAVPDNDQIAEIFIYDRITGSTRMVSRRQGQNLPSGSSHSLRSIVISGNGAALFYTSSATTIAGSAGGVFAYDRVLDQNVLLAASTRPDILSGASFDGEWLAYGEDRGAQIAVRLVRRSTGTNILVDHGPSAGQFSNGSSLPGGISADGTKVLFHSTATNLIGGLVDLNQASDVFLFDRLSGNTRLLSARANDPQRTSSGDSGRLFRTSLSSDGAFAVFPSRASDLVAGVADPDIEIDLFQSETTVAMTQLVTRAATPVVKTWTLGTAAGQVSADGRWFTQVRGNALMLRDRETGSSWLVSRSRNNPSQPADQLSRPQAISPDGRWVWFASSATDLVEKFVQSGSSSFPIEPTYLFDRNNGSVIMLTHKPGVPTTTLLNHAILGGVSDDARWTLFGTFPFGLIVGVEPTSPQQVFLYDRSTRSARLVSHAAGATGTPGNGESLPLGLSADGRWVLYRTSATNLLGNVVDTNNGTDVYLFDRDTGITVLLSHEAGASLRTANAASTEAVISADGSTVIIQSAASNLIAGLVDSNQGPDLFRYVVATGMTTLASHAAGQPLRTANGPSELQELPPQVFDSPDVRSLSANGQRLLVQTLATDLIAGVTDANSAADLYLLDLVEASARLLTHVPGTPLQAAPASNYTAMLAAGGERVLIGTTAALAANAGPSGFTEVFLNDPARGNRKLSVTVPNGDSNLIDLDVRGELLLFNSEANNLAPDVLDQNRLSDGFMAIATSDALFANGFEL